MTQTKHKTTKKSNKKTKKIVRITLPMIKNVQFVVCDSSHCESASRPDKQKVVNIFHARLQPLVRLGRLRARLKVPQTNPALVIRRAKPRPKHVEAQSGHVSRL